MKSKKFNIILISLKNTIIPIILCSFMIFLILFSTSKGGIYKDRRWEEKIRCVWNSGRVARTFGRILEHKIMLYIV